MSLTDNSSASTWEFVALPRVSRYLMSESEYGYNEEFWQNWMIASSGWADVVYKTGLGSSTRLLADCSMRMRLKLWTRVLDIPSEPNYDEFSRLVMAGSYSAWAEISRDSRRTFAMLLRKRPQLHLQLTRILHALSTRFSEVGYCQGMNFVAGTVLLAVCGIEDRSLLKGCNGKVAAAEKEFCAPSMVGSPKSAPPKIPTSSLSPTHASSTPPPDSFIAVIEEQAHSPNEVLAYKICEKLFTLNDYIKMYQLGVDTRLSIWAFDKLVESYFPDLYYVFSVKWQFYASSWFITLFTADLDLRSSIRVLDLYIAKGMKSLYRLGLACMCTQREKLLESGQLGDSAEGLKFLRSVACTAVAEHGIEKLILDSLFKFKGVTNKLLAELDRVGRVHGDAKLVFEKFVCDSDDDESDTSMCPQRPVWLIVPLPAEGVLPKPVIHHGKHRFGSSLFGRMGRKKKSKEPREEVLPQGSLLAAVSQDGQMDSIVVSPSSSGGGSRPRKKSSPSRFKSLQRKIVSLIPTGRGYAKTGRGEA